jgi:hypothetical protein
MITSYNWEYCSENKQEPFCAGCYRLNVEGFSCIISDMKRCYVPSITTPSFRYIGCPNNLTSLQEAKQWVYGWLEGLMKNSKDLYETDLVKNNES